jgi:hypothetical protein
LASLYTRTTPAMTHFLATPSPLQDANGASAGCFLGAGALRCVSGM